MTKGQRLAALRLIRGYRAVSGEAAVVLVGTLPADLAIGVRARLLILKIQGLENDELTESYSRIAEETMDEWMRRWDAVSGGAWTRRILPDLRQ